jgi:hypothetical protein
MQKSWNIYSVLQAPVPNLLSHKASKYNKCVKMLQEQICSCKIRGFHSSDYEELPSSGMWRCVGLV